MDEKRAKAPAHATGAVEFIPLDAILDDATFNLRDEGDVSELAANIGRLGQLTPIELRLVPGAVEGGAKWQVVAGFRRLAALRMLLRDRALARLHDTLSDDDAWGIAVTNALLTEPFGQGQLEGLRQKLAERGVAPWAGELIDEAIARAPVAPEHREAFFEWLKKPRAAGAEPAPSAPAAAPEAETEGEGEEAAEAAPAPEQVEEVGAEDFALDLAVRLYDINNDLHSAFEAWSDLPDEGRRLLLEQLRYIAELFPFIEEKAR